jgi:hypothetical protein
VEYGPGGYGAGWWLEGSAIDGFVDC